jgi:hypothetical protein
MNNELPPGLRVRKSKAGIARYYLKLPEQSNEMPLGANRREAINSWQQFRLKRWTGEHLMNGLVNLIDCFTECAIPIHDPDGRRALQNQADRLRQYFLNLGDPRLNDPIPGVEAYLDHQGTARRLRSGAEIYLLAHIFGWGRRVGLLPEDIANPWPSEAITIIRREQILDELREAVRLLLNANPPGTGVSGDDASARLALKALQQKIAAQLVADGRRDLARHLRSLNGAALERVLCAESVSCVVPDSSLILGTQRSKRLGVMRLQVTQTRRARNKSIIATTHEDMPQNILKKSQHI